MTWYIVLDGADRVLEAGDGVPSTPFERDRRVVSFESRAAFESDPIVGLWRERTVLLAALDEADQAATDQEYAMKADESRRWLDAHPSEDGATPDPELFPTLAIEMDECECTAWQAAMSIRFAVRATTLERIRARRKQKISTKRRWISHHEDHID